MFNKGAITLQIASILGGIGLLASAFAGYFSGQIVTNNSIANVKDEISSEVHQVDLKAQVNTTNIENIYKQLEQINKKLDKISDAFGVK